ncbi:hypothetical protein K492DRAFT_203118 [Lichtheimia hyalospora FSU 10163]|nr:hypothetical protein K492DRAFT_203118 [Lichtheimia hyalospora FSU 10163]
MEIPGYYFDRDKNRYFRITATGPHSRDAIKKAEQTAELQQENDNAKRIRNPLKQIGDDHIYQYLYSRQTTSNISSTTLINACNRALYRQMKPVQQLDNNERYSCTGVADFRSGEAVVTYGQGLVLRYGYQCEPSFQMWNMETPWHVGSSVTSLQLGPCYTNIQDGTHRQTVYGTSYGPRKSSELWRYSFLSQIDMDPDMMHANNHNNVIRSITREQPPAVLDCRFSLKKSCLWTTHYAHDKVVVGSDHGAYMLNSCFDVLGHIPTKTAVLAAQCVDDDRSQAWIGCRDGRLFLFDSRIPQPAKSITQSKVATAHVVSLDSSGLEHQILSVDIERSIKIWDMRCLRRTRQGSLHQPIKQLSGHDTTADQHIAFDISHHSRTVALVDGRQQLHFWSLDSNAFDNTPFWTSDYFQHNRIQSIHFIDASQQNSHAPGLVALAENPQRSSTSFYWFTAPL